MIGSLCQACGEHRGDAPPPLCDECWCRSGRPLTIAAVEAYIRAQWGARAVVQITYEMRTWHVRVFDAGAARQIRAGTGATLAEAFGAIIN